MPRRILERLEDLIREGDAARLRAYVTDRHRPARARTLLNNASRLVMRALSLEPVKAIAMIECMLDLGISANTIIGFNDLHLTPLLCHVAETPHLSPLIPVLVRRGADTEITYEIDIGFPYRHTPFLTAAIAGNLPGLKALKEAGANIEAVDRNNKNAADLATLNRGEGLPALRYLHEELGLPLRDSSEIYRAVCVLEDPDEFLLYLLGSDLDVNYSDAYSGNTALHNALYGILKTRNDLMFTPAEAINQRMDDSERLSKLCSRARLLIVNGARLDIPNRVGATAQNLFNVLGPEVQALIQPPAPATVTPVQEVLRRPDAEGPSRDNSTA